MDPEDRDRLLRALETDPAGADPAGADPTAADLPAADAAMLAYVDRLTRSPAAMGAGDVEALREAGFDDRAIHDICAIAGYYAFVNRIADGLGVELETRWDPS